MGSRLPSPALVSRTVPSQDSVMTVDSAVCALCQAGNVATRTSTPRSKHRQAAEVAEQGAALGWIGMGVRCYRGRSRIECARRIATYWLIRPGRGAPSPDTCRPAQKPKVRQQTRHDPKRVLCLGSFFVAKMCLCFQINLEFKLFVRLGHSRGEVP